MTPLSNFSFGSFGARARRAGLDGFLLALFGALFLAYLWPYPGSSEAPFQLAKLANYGVSIIFFFYGLKLNPAQLRTGLSNIRLHLLIHVSTFILFPILILGIKPFFQSPDNQTLWLGLFFLAALPSTVSSSVVMVSLAKGNLPAAIFNASISSLIGVFITPLWFGLVMDTTAIDFELSGVIIKLIIQVVLPVVLGLLLHRKLGAWAEKYRTQLRYFDQSIIILIVYTAFCESFAANMFDAIEWKDLFLLSIGTVALFFLVYGLILFICRALSFSREDTITALFCGSKKSLVQGAVMSKILFAGLASSGLILLPIMIYHAFQLLIVSSLAQRYSRNSP
ncbi:bile acid:sodium symporter family protein [Arundinibacter roseus]|uniref:Bile acid:sodium symporter n=1 Tax=Arundinibacter roseus TaxID=2070510 RepID=A0A4R4K8R4_9BACT|nr:bile acid:sodium symporter family protein [Arundinibacter roseus]TDB63980.1 bile acid:sodium symporter [Arundinibacter roseus]